MCHSLLEHFGGRLDSQLKPGTMRMLLPLFLAAVLLQDATAFAPSHASLPSRAVARCGLPLPASLCCGVKVVGLAALQALEIARSCTGHCVGTRT